MYRYITFKHVTANVEYNNVRISAQAASDDKIGSSQVNRVSK